MPKLIAPPAHLKNFDLDALVFNVAEVEPSEVKTFPIITGRWYVNTTTGVHARTLYDSQADVTFAEVWAPFYPDTTPDRNAHGNVGLTPGARRKAERSVRAHLARTDW